MLHTGSGAWFPNVIDNCEFDQSYVFQRKHNIDEVSEVCCL